MYIRYIITNATDGVANNGGLYVLIKKNKKKNEKKIYNNNNDLNITGEQIVYSENTVWYEST